MVAALCGGLLVACSSGPNPKPVAEAVAAGFTKGDLKGVFKADETGAYRAIVADFGSTKPTVSVAKVKVDGDQAIASLAWNWAFATKAWTYTTSLQMTRSGDTWTPTWSPSVVAALGTATKLTLTRTQAVRGRILDSAGAVLVGPRAVIRVGLDKAQTSTPEVAAQALAKAVGITESSYVDLVKAAGPKQFVPAITYREEEFTSELRARIDAIPGAVREATTLPLAPSKGFAGGLLGTVGPATAEIVSKSKGRIAAGDETGLSGLEQRYDATLSGTAGVEVKAAATTLFKTSPIAGKDLQVNLDLPLQNLADSILAGVGPASALVAIQPSTGKVLAIADGPGSKGYQNATIGRFPPGSTFKTVTSLALLRSGLTPDSKVPCSPEVLVDGRTFTNDSYYPPSALGSIPLSSAFANSCNTAYISQRTRLKSDDLVDAAAALGFGVDANTGYGSFFGQVPTLTTKTGAAAAMIGQGTVLASPLAMATVLSSVVAGHAVTPLLVQGVTVPARTPAHPLTAQEAQDLRAMLRGVVTTATGTGHGLADIPGAPVLAKTGTAEFQSGSEILTHAWMIAAQGDLAVAVFVDTGETGAGVAGPLLERFLRGAAH